MSFFLYTGLALAAAALATSLDDRPINRLAPPDAPAIVLFFAATDCPISNRYVPEVERLAAEFQPQRVRFWFVYPNPGDTAPVILEHDRAFHITTPTAVDAAQTLTNMARATTTPEAVVFAQRDGQLKEMYRGRIDDRYISLGKERPQAMHHDLEGAIRAVVQGKPVPPAGGPAVGCSIVKLQP
jgi:thiol-disulfide isomerase/thioredoxin